MLDQDQLATLAPARGRDDQSRGEAPLRRRPRPADGEQARTGPGRVLHLVVGRPPAVSRRPDPAAARHRGRPLPGRLSATCRRSRASSPTGSAGPSANREAPWPPGSVATPSPSISRPGSSPSGRSRSSSSPRYVEAVTWTADILSRWCPGSLTVQRPWRSPGRAVAPRSCVARGDLPAGGTGPERCALRRGRRGRMRPRPAEVRRPSRWVSSIHGFHRKALSPDPSAFFDLAAGAAELRALARPYHSQRYFVDDDPGAERRRVRCPVGRAGGSSRPSIPI